MKLDYQITEVQNNYYSEGFMEYETLCWKVWFSNKELLEDVNNEFKLNISIESYKEVPEELAHRIWQFVTKYKKYTGTFGTEYMNPVC